VKHTIQFGAGPEDALIATSGAASMDGLDAVVKELLSDDRYRPGMFLLFDHTELDLGALRAEDLVRRLHIALKTADLIGPRRIAVVSADRRIGDVRPMRRNEPPWKAFGSVDDGRSWLDAA
jgi:hypothetical protein